MFALISPSTDPYFNIAAEQWLLRQHTDDFLFLYQNTPCLIVGKHQNVWAEVNWPYCLAHQIPVVRRISGGGTVYHDLGNLNFCYIVNGRAERLVDFQRFIAPIISALKNWNIEAYQGERNDIQVSGLKISGHAEHIYKNRVLHHGTLLVHTDLSALNRAIETQFSKIEDKGIRSVRSQVQNISALTSQKISISQLQEVLIEEIGKSFTNKLNNFYLNPEDILKIEELVLQKFSLPSWNLGYSPASKIVQELVWNYNKYVASIQLEQGIIKHIDIEGVPALTSTLEAELIGKELTPSIASISLYSEATQAFLHAFFKAPKQ